MRTASRSWVLAVALAAAAAGCGDDAANVDGGLIALFDAAWPDAAVPDAFVCPFETCGTTCIDTSTDPFHCGMCDHTCTPSAECVASECACPSAFVPASVDDPDANVGSFGGSSNLFARTTVTGTDGQPHRVTVSWAPATVVVDADLDLATIVSPAVSLRFNTSGDGASGRFRFTAGTLRLTRACAEGVTGTLTGGTLAETEGGPGGGTVIPGGCGFTGIDFAFDLGAACGSSVDAGVADAGTPDASI